MADNEYLGSVAIISWVYATGTAALNTEFRTWNYTPTIDFVDATAGADTSKRRVPSFKDGSMKLTMLMQSTMASADYSCLDEGTLGTVIYNPAGTAAGKLKITLPAYSQGITITEPYNDIVQLDISWQQNGARVLGTN